MTSLAYSSTEPFRYPQRPVTLDIDTWLYEYEEHPDCGVCVALDKECREAIEQNRLRAAYEASSEIRNGHPEHTSKAGA
ncbi:hypothetical protein [Streptomyces sp. NPDC001415]